MSSFQPEQAQSGQGSAGLTISLSSNNPFRNRAASPGIPQSPASPFDDPPPRPLSRNPFLDPSNQSSPPLLLPTGDRMSVAPAKKSPTAEDIFGLLTLDDSNPAPPANTKSPPPEPSGRRPSAPMIRPPGAPGPRGENVPPPGRRAPPNHRPTRSQEEALRARKPQQGDSANKGPSGVSPHKKPERRPRRNSDSSVVSEKLTEEEKKAKEAEKKAKEARRRERERRHREGKTKPARRLDIIDQMDATGFFGTTGVHHDGPYDALTSHRNRKGSRRAPMQAFPKDSLNNVLGGSGPLNTRPDHAAFLGNADDEAFMEYSGSARPVGSSAMPLTFDPLSRGAILHGDQTLGLGTSTFLEGTPAARAAIQRSEAETAADSTEIGADGGLQRKKSLAQRIRGINRGPSRNFGPSGRLTNPEGTYTSRRSPSGDMQTPGATSSSLQGRQGERNPFFEEYDSKGDENISVRRTGSTDGKKPMSPSPGAGLERRVTADATTVVDENQSKATGSGLLARVKSLKGGRKPQRPSDAAAQPPPGSAL